LHTETACRRSGALGVHLEDFDPDRSLVKLRKKGQHGPLATHHPALANCLVDHAAARSAILSTDPLLRYRDGHPLISRRYDHLWKRLGERLPWVAAQSISTHWLRHTTLTWVERHFRYGIARAYARHTDNTGPAITTYIKASLREAATTLVAMTGQPHHEHRGRRRIVVSWLRDVPALGTSGRGLQRDMMAVFVRMAQTLLETDEWRAIRPEGVSRRLAIILLDGLRELIATTVEEGGRASDITEVAFRAVVALLAPPGGLSLRA
jgi:hypothetical protein